MGYRPENELSIGSQYFYTRSLETVSPEVKIRPVKGDPDYIAPARTTGSIGSQHFSRPSLETIGQEIRIRPRIRPVKGDPDYIAPAGPVGGALNH